MHGHRLLVLAGMGLVMLPFLGLDLGDYVDGRSRSGPDAHVVPGLELDHDHVRIAEFVMGHQYAPVLPSCVLDQDGVAFLGVERSENVKESLRITHQMHLA